MCAMRTTCIFSTTSKYIGIVALGSDVIACAPRDEFIGWTTKVSLPTIHNATMKTDKQLPPDSWLQDVPFDTRGHGVQDAVSAYKTCMTNKTNGNISHFKLRFKSMKDPSQIFWISKKALVQTGADVKLFKQRLKGKSKLRFTKKDKAWLKTHTLDNDAKIQREGSGQFYLIVNFKRRVEFTPKAAVIASLDPGTRTFQTMYSEGGVAVNPTLQTLKWVTDFMETECE